MTTVKVKSLLLIGGMILAMTACAQSSPQTASTGTNKEPAAWEENKEEEEQKVQEEKEEKKEKDQAATSEEKPDNTAGKKESKISDGKASLFDPKQISFEENKFTKYLEDESPEPEGDSMIKYMAFGFNPPEGYESIEVDQNGEKHYSDQDPILFMEETGEDYYSAMSDDGQGYLYVFTLNQSADVVREYLKSDAWPKLCSFGEGSDYPILVMGDTVNKIEKEETLDTIYGSCDILFAELETDSVWMEELNMENPIYIEAAYFSLKVPVEEKSLVIKEIAVIYMYPPKDKTINTYQGYLAELLPDMLTPINQ